MTPRLSGRLPWRAELTELARAEASAAPSLDLTVSNPTRAGLSPSESELRAALAARGVDRYDPQPLGLASAREAVARYYAESHGLAVDPADIVLTASTSEAYALLFKVLCDPGEELLGTVPGYPLFEHLAALEGARLTQAPLGFDGAWHLDTRALLARLTPQTRAVLLVSPSNPTGHHLDARERGELLPALAAQRSSLLVDEVFLDYPLARELPWQSAAAATEGCCVALSGLSKVCALPQLKLAWLVLAGEPTARAALRGALELACDAYLSVAAPVQLAAGALLGLRGAVQQRIRARSRANLGALRELLGEESACSLVPAEGGWYATLRVPATRTSAQWCLRLLAEDCVRAQPGELFDFPREAFLVLSLLTDPAVFREGVERLLARVEREA